MGARALSHYLLLASCLTGVAGFSVSRAGRRQLALSRSLPVVAPKTSSHGLFGDTSTIAHAGAVGEVAPKQDTSLVQRAVGLIRRVASVITFLPLLVLRVLGVVKKKAIASPIVVEANEKPVEAAPITLETVDNTVAAARSASQTTAAAVTDDAADEVALETAEMETIKANFQKPAVEVTKTAAATTVAAPVTTTAAAVASTAATTTKTPRPWAKKSTSSSSSSSSAAAKKASTTVAVDRIERLIDQMEKINAWQEEKFSVSGLLPSAQAVEGVRTTTQVKSIDKAVDKFVGKIEADNTLDRIKSAGVAGSLAYGITEVMFWALSLPVAATSYYQTTGVWPDMSTENGLPQVFALSAAFLTAARLAVPLRLGFAVALIPFVEKKLLDNEWVTENVVKRYDIGEQ